MADGHEEEEEGKGIQKAHGEEAAQDAGLFDLAQGPLASEDEAQDEARDAESEDEEGALGKRRPGDEGPDEAHDKKGGRHEDVASSRA